MSKKILVIDDERYILEMIQLRLEEEDFTVEILNCGDESESVVIEFKPDLILMDLIMETGISGLETIKKLKVNEQTANVPILVLSGKTMEEDKEEALSAGASGFISKPILPIRLIEEIKKFFKR